MAKNTLMRLALTTVVAIVLVVVNLPLGMGVLGGVPAFYLLFVVSLVATLLRREPSRERSRIAGQRGFDHGRQLPHIKLLGLTVNKYDVISSLVAGLLVIGIGLAVRVHVTAGVPARCSLPSRLSRMPSRTRSSRPSARRGGGSCRSR